jgi:hypothetical protein
LSGRPNITRSVTVTCGATAYVPGWFCAILFWCDLSNCKAPGQPTVNVYTGSVGGTLIDSQMATGGYAYFNLPGSGTYYFDINAAAGYHADPVTTGLSVTMSGSTFSPSSHGFQYCPDKLTVTDSLFGGAELFPSGPCPIMTESPSCSFYCGSNTVSLPAGCGCPATEITIYYQFACGDGAIPSGLTAFYPAVDKVGYTSMCPSGDFTDGAHIGSSGGIVLSGSGPGPGPGCYPVNLTGSQSIACPVGVQTAPIAPCVAEGCQGGTIDVNYTVTQ